MKSFHSPTWNHLAIAGMFIYAASMFVAVRAGCRSYLQTPDVALFTQFVDPLSKHVEGKTAYFFSPLLLYLMGLICALAAKKRQGESWWFAPAARWGLLAVWGIMILLGMLLNDERALAAAKDRVVHNSSPSNELVVGFCSWA